MIEKQIADILFLTSLVSIVLGVILLTIKIPKESKWYDKRDFASIGLMVLGLCCLVIFIL